MSAVFQIVLVTGEQRLVTLPSHTGSVANVLDRLDAWIETTDGGWVQKRHVVEVRVVERSEPDTESAEELRQLDTAASHLARAKMDDQLG
jgi:hypothetical protein